MRTGQKSGASIDTFATAEGTENEASGSAAHAEGWMTKASGSRAHAEGQNTTASGSCAHAEGYVTTASGTCAHAEGQNTTASGSCAHAEGYATTAGGNYAHAGGVGTIAAGNSQTVVGRYNIEIGDPSSVQTVFIVGGGDKNAKLNAFRVSWNGHCFAAGDYVSSGADYAEYFEWLDGNVDCEDRRGYFVTLGGNQIKMASPGDYILGIVSATPVVIGNSDPNNWHQRFLKDDFGSYIMQTVTERVPTGEDTYEEVTHETYILNPDFDESKDQEYVPRSERPEWSPIGMMGQLIVRDDGSCQVNGYCKVADGGIATTSDTGWRVIERVTENLVKIVFR